jgi:uncharacterized protein
MLSVKPWKLDGFLLLAMSLLVGIASFSLALGLVAHFSRVKPDADTPVLLVLRSLALDGSILIAVFLFLRTEHMSWAEAFGFKTPRLWNALMWGIIIGLICSPICQKMNERFAVILEHFHVQIQNEQAVETLEKATPGFNRFYLIFFAVIIAPICEETLFRGILYPAIKQAGFPRIALWGTSLLFALVHLSLTAFVPLVLLAATLAILYEKTNNLLACITAHMVFNGYAVIMMFHVSPVTHPPY